MGRALLCFYEQFVPKWKVAADASLPQKNDRIIVNRSFRTAEMLSLKWLQASGFHGPSSGSTISSMPALAFPKELRKTAAVVWIVRATCAEWRHGGNEHFALREPALMN